MMFERQGIGRHLGSYSQGESSGDRTALQYSWRVDRDLDIGPLFE